MNDYLELYNYYRQKYAKEARALFKDRGDKAIHHIDGNRFNNDPSNLVLVDVELG